MHAAELFAVAGALKSKFSPPAARIDDVSRQGLVERLDAGGHARLALVYAPAGYGKTTLLRQLRDHIDARGERHGWLTLVSGDLATDTFLLWLGIALHRAGAVVNPQALRAAIGQAADHPDRAVDTFLSAVEVPQRPTYLLIDRIDLIGSTPALRTLEGLIRGCDFLRVRATARRRPKLALSALRADGHLMEVFAAELTFTLEDTLALLGEHMPVPYLAALVQHTGGIPVALRLAQRAIETADPETPWTDWLDEYFEQHVLARLPQRLRELLARLAIVESFDSSLASAIAHRDAGAVLNRLHRKHGLLSYDTQSGIYRLSPTLRGCCARQLRKVGHAEVRQLHGRASEWYAGRGRYLEALSHALGAEDTGRVSSLFPRVGGMRVLLRAGLPALEAILDRLPSSAVDSSVLVHLSRVLLLMQQGELSEAAALSRSMPLPPPSGGSGPLSGTLVASESLLVDTLLSAYTDRRVLPCRDAELRQLAGETASADPLYHGLLQNMVCWLDYERAEFDFADRAADDAIAQFTAEGGLYGAVFMHLHRLLIRFWQNRLDAALEQGELAARLSRLFFPTDRRLAWLSGIFRALVLFELGKLDETGRLLERLGAGEFPAEGWFEPQLISFELAARYAACRGDLRRALSVLDHGRRVAERRDLPRLDWNMRQHQYELQHAAGMRAMPEPDLQIGVGSPGPDYLTWRERLNSVLSRGRMAILDGQPAGAEAALREIPDIVPLPDVPRAAIRGTLLEAHLALSLGDRPRASELVARATSAFVGTPSARLVADQAPELTLFVSLSTTPPAVSEALLEPLTERELAVLELLETGSPNKVIAYQVGISEATVKFHLRNIYRKLNARNRVQALTKYRNGLMHPTTS